MIVELLLDAGNGAKLIFERGALLHHALRALLVIPEIRVFRFAIELGETSRGLVDVKDASSAARPTA
jgi:hypothetical protein